MNKFYLPISGQLADWLYARMQNELSIARRYSNDVQQSNLNNLLSVGLEVAVYEYFYMRVYHIDETKMLKALWWEPKSTLGLTQPEIKSVKVSEEIFNAVQLACSELRDQRLFLNYPEGVTRAVVDAIVFNFIRLEAHVPDWFDTDVPLCWKGIYVIRNNQVLDADQIRDPRYYDLHSNLGKMETRCYSSCGVHFDIMERYRDYSTEGGPKYYRQMDWLISHFKENNG